MSESVEKPCPYCLKPVLNGARKCPHCQAWLSRSVWSVLSGFGALIYIPLVLFLSYYFFMRPLDRPREDFAAHLDEVRITETLVDIRPSSGSNYIYVLGRIRNDSPVKWENPYFEVHCFDADGKLIDTYSTYESGMILVPDTDHAFRLSFTPHQPIEKYKDYKVFLRDARDAKRWL
jgi:hypothetical protein